MVTWGSQKRDHTKTIDKGAAVTELMQPGALGQIAREDDRINGFCLQLAIQGFDDRRCFCAKMGVGKVEQGGHDFCASFAAGGAQGGGTITVSASGATSKCRGVRMRLISPSSATLTVR